MHLHVGSLFSGAVLLVGSSAAALAQSDVTLEVGCYGGAFTGHTGIKIVWIYANPSDHLAKMIASKGRPDPYDVVCLDDDIEAEGINAGVFGKSDAGDLPESKISLR